MPNSGYNTGEWSQRGTSRGRDARAVSSRWGIGDRSRWLRVRTQFTRPHLPGLLAGAYLRVGQAEAGLQALDEALALAEQTGARSYELTSLYR